MFEVLLWTTGLTILVAMTVAYVRSSDPLHPLMYMGPLLLYAYVYIPAALFYQDLLQPYYAGVEDILPAQTINFLGVLLFCIGCLYARIPASEQRYVWRPVTFSPDMRRRLRVLSYVLAACGLVAYVVLLSYRGGMVEAYSRIKGGGWSPSGYISEAPLLTLPAILVYLLSRHEQRLNLKAAALVLLFASPHLLQGLLGARRGPAFLAFAAIGFGYYLSTAHRPRLRTVIASVGAVGLLMIFLASQRKQIFIGSEFDFDSVTFQDALFPSTLEVGHTTVVSWDIIRAADFHKKHYWGKRYLVQLLVRPIPKQLWPTKYEDTGMEWLVREPGSGGFSEFEWRAATGRPSERGSAAGFIADAYLEFGRWGLLVCLLVGLAYGMLWKRGILYRGIWSVFYLEAAVVSVYLPTQSVVSAWLYRFLYLSIPSWLLWRWFMKSPRSGRRVIPGSYRPPLND